MAYKSIRLLIPLVTVVPLLATVGTLGLLSHKGGRAAVRDVSTLLGGKVIDQSRDRVATFLSRRLSILEVVAASAKTGEVTVFRDCNDRDPRGELDCLERMTDFLYSIMQSRSVVYSMLFSSSDGNFVSIERGQEQTTLVRRQASTGENFRWLRAEGDSVWVPAEEEEEDPSFNPLERPWVMQAQATASYGELYKFSEGGMGLTASIAVFDGNRYVGVLAIDLRLSNLEQRLVNIASSLGDRARITISKTSTDDPFAISGGTNGSDDPLSTFNCERSTSGTDGDCSTGTRVDLDGVPYLVVSRPLNRTSEGLPNWEVSALVPESQFAGQLQANARHFAFVAMGLVAGSAVMGIVVNTVWIAIPIARLGKAAREIDEDHFNPNSLDDLAPFPEELDALTKLFQVMGKSINERMQIVNKELNKLRSDRQMWETAAGEGVGKYHALLERSRAFRKDYKSRSKS